MISPLRLFLVAPLTLLSALAPWSPLVGAPPSTVAPSESRAEANSSAGRPTAAPQVRGDRHRALSTSFSVRSDDPSHPADRVAAEFERRRHELQQQWLGRAEAGWTPRCEVVIHANENAYLRHLGPRAAMTRGVSKIDRQSDRIISRHISLMADPQSGELTALAHELTHLVLADRFTSCQPPRWVDEGIALLADDGKKKRLHLRDLHEALTDQCCPGVGEALAMRDYPKGPQLAAFYGQSLSLVSYLMELGDPAQVVDMVALAMDHGYDTALHETYGITGTAELERRWRRHLSGQPPLIARAH